MNQTCKVCKAVIKVMIHKNDGFCGSLCQKELERRAELNGHASL